MTFYVEPILQTIGLFMATLSLMNCIFAAIYKQDTPPGAMTFIALGITMVVAPYFFR